MTKPLAGPHAAILRRGRRTAVQALGAATAALALPARAQKKPVRVGYALARTGPWTGGDQVIQEPNYLLWAEQQNAAGGLDVKGERRPIELGSFDDRSGGGRGDGCAPGRAPCELYRFDPCRQAGCADLRWITVQTRPRQYPF